MQGSSASASTIASKNMITMRAQGSIYTKTGEDLNEKSHDKWRGEDNPNAKTSGCRLL